MKYNYKLHKYTIIFRCDYICNRISTGMGYVSHVTHVKHPITIKHIQEQPIGAQYYLATVLVLYTGTHT